MSDTKFKAGYVVKSTDNTPVGTLSEALRNLAACAPCGCDDKLGYITMTDIATGDLQIAVVRNGVWEVYPWDDDHLSWLREACIEREGGRDIPDPPQIPD